MRNHVSVYKALLEFFLRAFRTARVFSEFSTIMHARALLNDMWVYIRLKINFASLEYRLNKASRAYKKLVNLIENYFEAE